MFAYRDGKNRGFKPTRLSSFRVVGDNDAYRNKFGRHIYIHGNKRIDKLLSHK